MKYTELSELTFYKSIPPVESAFDSNKKGKLYDFIWGYYDYVEYATTDYWSDTHNNGRYNSFSNGYEIYSIRLAPDPIDISHRSSDETIATTTSIRTISLFHLTSEALSVFSKAQDSRSLLEWVAPYLRGVEGMRAAWLYASLSRADILLLLETDSYSRSIELVNKWRDKIVIDNKNVGNIIPLFSTSYTMPTCHINTNDGDAALMKRFYDLLDHDARIEISIRVITNPLVNSARLRNVIEEDLGAYWTSIPNISNLDDTKAKIMLNLYHMFGNSDYLFFSDVPLWYFAPLFFCSGAILNSVSSRFKQYIFSTRCSVRLMAAVTGNDAGAPPAFCQPNHIEISQSGFDGLGTDSYVMRAISNKINDVNALIKAAVSTRHSRDICTTLLPVVGILNDLISKHILLPRATRHIINDHKYCKINYSFIRKHIDCTRYDINVIDGACLNKLSKMNLDDDTLYIYNNQIADDNEATLDALSQVLDSLSRHLTDLLRSDRHFFEEHALLRLSFANSNKLVMAYSGFLIGLEAAVRQNEESRYAFLIQAKDGNEMTSVINFNHLSPLSVSGAYVEKRIIVLLIPENNLFYVSRALFFLCHELAHYVGERLRSQRRNIFYEHSTRYISNTIAQYMVAQYIDTPSAENNTLNAISLLEPSIQIEFCKDTLTQYLCASLDATLKQVNKPKDGVLVSEGYRWVVTDEVFAGCINMLFDEERNASAVFFNAWKTAITGLFADILNELNASQSVYADAVDILGEAQKFGDEFARSEGAYNAVSILADNALDTFANVLNEVYADAIAVILLNCSMEEYLYILMQAASADDYRAFSEPVQVSRIASLIHVFWPDTLSNLKPALESYFRKNELSGWRTASASVISALELYSTPLNAPVKTAVEAYLRCVFDKLLIGGKLDASNIDIVTGTLITDAARRGSSDKRAKLAILIKQARLAYNQWIECPATAYSALEPFWKDLYE